MAFDFAAQPLGEHAYVQGGFAYPSREFTNFGVSVLKIKNVRFRDIDTSEVSYVTRELAKQTERFYAQPGDVLISMTGSGPHAPDSMVGRVARFTGPANTYLINQRVGRVVIKKPSDLDLRYLFFVLTDPAFQMELVSVATGSANQSNISGKQIELLRIPVPPLRIQQTIAHVLGSLDDLIELNRRMNRTLEQMAAAIFKAWFVDFVPVKAIADGAKSFPPMPKEVFDALPTEFTDSPLGPIPKAWEVRAVSDIAELNGWTLSKRDELDWIEYVEISEVMRGDINKLSLYERGTEPSRARRRLRHGDTVMSTVRPDRGAYFLCLNPSSCLIASTGFVTLTPTKAPWSFVQSATARHDVLEELGRLADGGAYPAVRPDVVGALELAVPVGDSMLDAFHDVVAPLYEKAHLNRRESHTLAEIRDALLPRLLSGEIRVGGDKRIVEEVA